MYQSKKTTTDNTKEHMKHITKIDRAIAEKRKIQKEVDFSFSQIPLDYYPNSEGFDLMRRGVEIICAQEIEMLEEKKAAIQKELRKMTHEK